MNNQFISITDIDDNLHTINSNFITRITWGEDRDADGIVDMIYLTEGAECAEIALKPKSNQSRLLMAGLNGSTNHAKVLKYLKGEND